jgi:hypothetical protein
MIVKDNVKDFFIAEGFECDFGKVDVHRNTTTRGNGKIVPYPYQGPNISWLMPKLKINLDIKRTVLETKIECETCNLREYKFKMNGIVIPSTEINGAKIFKIKQFGQSSATYVTEEALRSICIKGFSNFWYREVGYIE